MQENEIKPDILAESPDGLIDRLGVKGEVTAILYDENGNVKSVTKSDNLINNRGLNYLIQKLYSRLTNLTVTHSSISYTPTANPFVYMIVGYSSGPAEVTATEANTSVPNTNVSTIYLGKAVNGGTVSSLIKTFSVYDNFDYNLNIKVDAVVDGRMDAFSMGTTTWDLNFVNVANTDLFDFNITNAGKLTMDLNTNSCTIDGGSAIFSVPYAYTYVAGDFDAELQVTSTPTSSGDMAGLCVRDDSLTDTQKNNLFICNKHNGSNVITTCGNTDPSNGTVLSESNTDDHKFFKITRRSTVFATYSKAAVGDSWTARESYTRADLSSTVQVGAFTGSTNAYVGKFEYMKINDTYPCMIDVTCDFPGASFTPSAPQVVNTIGFTSTAVLSTAVWGSRVNINQVTVQSTDTLRIIYRISIGI